MTYQFKFHYWLLGPDNNPVDSSEGGEPLVLTQGSGQIVPGLEEALVNHQSGDAFEVLIPCEKAYGQKKEENIQKVPLSQFEGIDEVVAGMKFQTGSGKDAAVVQVVEVDEFSATIDANHPLAGLDLNFKVELIEKTEVA